MGKKRARKTSPTTSVDASAPEGDVIIAEEEVSGVDEVNEASNTAESVGETVEAPKQVSADSEPSATIKEEETKPAESKTAEGDVAGEEIPLYPLPVKGPAGESITLQVSPSDPVADIRQCLSDTAETCFYTSFDLIMNTKDGTKYQLIDFIELGEVTDITAGGCFLEMYPTLYTEGSIRAHIQKLRELVSFTLTFTSHSTALAAKVETARALLAEKEGSEKEGKPAKAATGVTLPAELEHLNVGEHNPGLLQSLLAEIGTDESECYKSLAFSSFNPVPGFRRLQGDLAYLDLVTLEGKFYPITAHTRGFVVNSSEGHLFHPEPSQPKQEASTLLGLLKLLSPKFTTAFAEVTEKKAARHTFENVLSSVRPNPWLGAHPLPPHCRHEAHFEEAMALPYGMDLFGLQRDWNEELQALKELPKTTLQDRLMRDRAINRVMSDFVDASIKGAKAVVYRTIPPMNPTDIDRFHMYVHNNIFFSLAADGDFAVLQQLREKELQANAELEKQKQQQTSTEPTPAAAGDAQPAPAAEADAQKAENSTDGAQLADSEQTTYAAANNDLKGTRIINNLDLPGLNTLAMTIVDFRGHRVIAQSIVPGILYGDKTTALKYGSVDSGAHIKFTDSFHEKFLEASDALHLKEHEVKDKEGTVVKLCVPVECKGILGSDGRQYLLDPTRFTPKDTNSNGPTKKYHVVRPELLALYCQHEQVDRWMKSTGATEWPSKEKIAELKEKKELPAITFNPNILTEFEVVGEKQVLEKDEEEVKKLSTYLTEKAIPALVQGFRSLDLSPIDGKSLSETLHEQGINLRYLGKVAKATESIPYIHKLCVTEMVVRACKRVLKAVLRETYDQDVAGAVAHFINCFIGTSKTTMFAATADSAPATVSDPPPKTGGTLVAAESAPAAAAAVAAAPAGKKAQGEEKKEENTPGKGKGKKGKGKSGKTSPAPGLAAPAAPVAPAAAEAVAGVGDKKEETPVVDDRPGYIRITSEMVWSDIVEGVKVKYDYELPKDVRYSVRSIATLRNLVLKMGIVVAAREYDLQSEAPLNLEDVQDMLPLVKHATPLSQDVSTLVEKGQALMTEVGLSPRSKVLGQRYSESWLHDNQDKLNEAFDFFSEAYNVLQHVVGPIHPHVALCCRQISSILHHAGQWGAATLHQHRALVVEERCLGLDDPLTIRSYANIARSFLHYGGESHAELALRLLIRGLAGLAVTSGMDHPEAAEVLVTLSAVYQEARRMNPSLRYLQEALKTSERLLEEDNVQTASCYRALALSSNSMKAFKLAVQHESKALAILEKHLGKKDPRTSDAATQVQIFRKNEEIAQYQKANLNLLPAGIKNQSLSALSEVIRKNPHLLKSLQMMNGGKNLNSPQAIAEAVVRLQQTAEAEGSGTAVPAKPPTAAPAAVPPPQKEETRPQAPAASRKKASKGATGKSESASDEAKPSKLGAGLGAGLGVGLGAVTGTPPPLKSGSVPARKQTGSLSPKAAGPASNGPAVPAVDDSAVQQPLGLGLGLDGYAKKVKGSKHKQNS